MKLNRLASSALALLSVVPNVYSQESTSIVLKGSSGGALRGSSKFLVKKVEEYALLSKDKGSEGPPGGGGGGPPPGGDNGPGGGDGPEPKHGHDGPPDNGPNDHSKDHNKHGGPPDGPGGPGDDDQNGPPGPGHNNHHDGPPGPPGDDDCPPGMVGCDPATWGPGNKKPPKPPKPSKDDDGDDDGPPKPPHKHHHHDDDDDEGDDDDFDNTREVPDIPYEIKKLGKGYCDTDNQLGHLNKCVELYDEYCKTDLLMEENDDICEYLGYGGDDVVMSME